MNDSNLSQSTVFDIFTGKPVNQPPKEVFTTTHNHLEYDFILPFSGHFIFSPMGHGIGHCKVILKNEGSEFIHVLIHEPINTGSTSVTNRIEHVATQIYWGFLQGRNPRKITWAIKYEKEAHASIEYILPVQLYWNGHRFWYHRNQEEGASDDRS